MEFAINVPYDFWRILMTGYGAGLNFTSKTVAKQIILLYMSQLFGRCIDCKKKYSKHFAYWFEYWNVLLSPFDILASQQPKPKINGRNAWNIFFGAARLHNNSGGFPNLTKLISFLPLNRHFITFLQILNVIFSLGIFLKDHCDVKREI